MQVCLHAETHRQVEPGGEPGAKQTRRRRSHSAPIIVSIAIAAKGAFITFVESVPIFPNRSSRNRRVAKIAVPVYIWPPSLEVIMTARFHPIMKSPFCIPVVRGCIRTGVIRPLMLCATSQRQRKCQYRKCNCFTHNLPSNTNKHSTDGERFRIKPRFRRSVAQSGRKFFSSAPRYSCKGDSGPGRLV